MVGTGPGSTDRPDARAYAGGASLSEDGETKTVSFETEKLEDFHNLVRALQQVKEFRHNRRFGHPTLLGTMSPLDEILEKFAQ